MRYLLIIRGWKLTFFFFEMCKCKLQATQSTRFGHEGLPPLHYTSDHIMSQGGHVTAIGHNPPWTSAIWRAFHPMESQTLLETRWTRKSPGWTSGTWIFEKLLSNSDAPGPLTTLENSVLTPPPSPDCEFLRGWRGPHLLHSCSPQTSTELTQARCSLNIYSNWITTKVEVVIASRLFSWISFS